LSGVTGALWIVGAGYLASIVIPGLRPEWSQMRRPAAAAPIPGSELPQPRPMPTSDEPAGARRRQD
jgi:hypothetical protein